MRTLTTLLLAVSATSISSATIAADAISIPVSSNVAVPVADGKSFDWNGFYTGVYGVVQSSPAGGVQYGAGLNAGVNAQFDFFLVGGEVAIQGLAGGAGGTGYAQVIGKAGVLVTDNVAVFGAAGYGIDTGAPLNDQVLVGGGLELAVADDLSVKAQYLHGFPITGANPVEQVQIGANFHF